MLRGTATARGGLFRIVQPFDATTSSIVLQRWIGIEQRMWQHTSSLGQRVQLIGRPENISTRDFADRGHRWVIVFLPQPLQVGTILTYLMDTNQITAPSQANWTDALAAQLDPARQRRIYANGTWKPRTPPHTNHYFLTGNTHHAGGCLVLMATDRDWARAHVIVLPFTAVGLSTNQGGSPALVARSSPTVRASSGSLFILTSSDATRTVPATLSCAIASGA